MFNSFNSDRPVAHIVPVALFAVLTLSPVEFVRAGAPEAAAPSVTLQYRSADLDTPHGTAILYRRIRSAASSVCGAYDNALSEEKVQWSECVDQAVAQAVASVHSETLTAYHEHRVGRGKRPWIDAPTSLAARQAR
jgi:UrcA family protein